MLQSILDRGERGESSGNRENAIVHPSIETGTALQEIEVGLAYDMKPLIKQEAENNYPSFGNNQHTLTVCPCKETGAQLEDIDVALAYDIKPFMKQEAEKPRRKQFNKSPTSQTEMTGVLMPESKETAVSSFSDFDMGTKDETSAHRQILNVQMDNVVAETLVDLAYKDTWMKQVLHNYTALPEGERKRVRKKRSNKTFTPKKMTGELTKPIISEPTIISLSENTQAPSTCLPKSNLLEVKQNARNKNKRKGLAKAEDGNIGNVQASTVNMQMEMVGCEEEHSGTNERADNSSMNLIGAHYNGLHSSKFLLQFPSTCLPKSNPPGRKRNAVNKNKRKGLAEVEEVNISKGQASTVNLEEVGCEGEYSGTTERADNGQAPTVKLLMEMVGCGREHSGTTEHADNGRVDLIGALHSYQSKFPLQFPNIPKKRRTEKGKTSNTHITSSVITKYGVPVILAPEDAQVHPYASNDSSWMYGLRYNAAGRRIINESRENYIHNTQTFDEFRLSLRRMAEVSPLPNQTCDYNSLMRIRNCTEPNYNAKQLDFSDRQTIKEAEGPQTCTDILVEDMPVSCAKKKRSRKRSVLSNYIHNTQTFDEFRLSLRRMAEVSPLPNQTCDYNSLMRIRNSTEPNYNAKQLDFSDRQTIKEAEGPQTCTDILVEDMPVSCAKKKRSRKRSVLSNYIHNTQTFDEFRLSLRRMAEVSPLPNQTCDYNSLMRIRNSTEPNYNAKQLDFSDRQTIKEAEGPQTCTDILVEDMLVSCAKKKRSRKRSVLSNYIHNTQTFDEFRLSLRRMAEVSPLPNQTCDYDSLMRIRNSTEPNYNAKQLDFSDRQTIKEAEGPQTCTDILVEDMPVSCAKKKRSRKRSVLSNSMRPNKDEMQQCHNSSNICRFFKWSKS